MPTSGLCLVLLAALGMTSCASSQLVNQWINPAYKSSSFKKIMVIGVTKQAAIRRNFEDEFVAQLKAAGVNATPSYLYIPQDGPVGEAVLKQALKEAAADAVIITRLVRVQQKTEIAPGYYAPDPGMAIHPLYTTAWNDYYAKRRDYLLSVQQADGEWWGDGVGDVYGTAIALIILQLPFNQLPIMQP